MSRAFSIAVVGATGLVGSELISILEERCFPVSQWTLLTCKESAGERVQVNGQSLTIQTLQAEALKDVDIAFIAAEASIAEQVAEWIQGTKTILIDQSNAFRWDEKVPLVVAEVNPEDIAQFKIKNVIACPNANTVPIVQLLAPLDHQADLSRVVVASYQAVSGVGREGMEELESQTRDLFSMREIKPKHFAHRIAFNILPHIPGEEEGLLLETRRILKKPDLKMATTCAQVPVFNGYSAAVHMEFRKPITEDTARPILEATKGLQIVDDVSEDLYPTPAEASGGDATLVGRIRNDDSVEHGLAAWYSCDNLRTGSALNAVKIAEILAKEYLR
ncbi:MAG: aspartate-semialdehyde dehydrogenase [Myxococcaceae bacterium]|nr:aspartate-semialdehyde dehydrogenase [Myxococcaceae bacterium]MBH2006865.1 aspartate-semialdehyde dehydrogenase [Myxococcaceae bacterium]